MRPRAIKDLDQLCDRDFFREAAAGMRLCVVNALNLWRDARALARARRHQGFRIIQCFVEEEAAKFLILLDAVRCPRQPDKKLFTRQLGYFTDHLAKGIYAKTAWRLYTSFAEVRQMVDSERELLYLDGPNDFDWIFGNAILGTREESIYVDYLETDTRHEWRSPDLYRRGLSLPWKPSTLTIALAIQGAGLTTSAALEVIAARWRTVDMTDNLALPNRIQLNQETIEALDARDLLRRRPHRVYQTIIDHWQFPLYSLDLAPLKVDLDALREKQQKWTPE
jgi:AbiV family abortive infection protein